MRTAAISAPTSYGFAGLNGAALEEARSEGFGTLDRLPAEVLDHIVLSDPEATLRLMDTSHHMEGFIIGTVLRPLYDVHGNSIAATRRFISSALQRGKTASQIVLLSKLLTDTDTDVRGRRLVQIGILNVRSHNALCPELINLLAHPDVALYAFGLDFPLLGTEDLRSRRRLMGNLSATDTRSIECIGGKRVYVNGLDKVFLQFSDWFKEINMKGLFAAQYEHSRQPAHALILPSNRDCFVAHEKDFSAFTDSHVAMVASVDAGSLALSMERYMSAEILKTVNRDAPAGQCGVLYAAMFCRNRPAMAISIRPTTPVGPWHRWGDDSYLRGARPPAKAMWEARSSKSDKPCVLL